MASSLISVRKSGIAGKGVFARRQIRKGTRIIEYKGTRRKECDCPDNEDCYVDLFDVGKGIVIDPKEKGNAARFINHSCSPNCETIQEDDRIYIHSIRTIRQGEELNYDYQLSLGHTPTARDKARYQCKCGSENCIGTIYKPRKKKKKSAARAGKKL
jgi:SET domain-containing protein